MTARVALLASHEGTTAQAVMDACADGSLPAQVVLLISNNRGAGALTRAARAGVPTLVLSSVTHPDPAELDRAVRDALLAADTDLVVLGGYMKKLGDLTLDAYRGRIINTHPALLPRHGGAGMYGDRVHAAVLAAGDRTSGASVHEVIAEYDAGRVLAQVEVPVEPGDTVETLGRRVRDAEKTLLIETIARLLG